MAPPLESVTEQVESVSLFNRIRTMKSYDLMETAREICNEVKKRHRENKVVMCLSPKNIFINEQQVSIDQSPDSLDSEWSSPDSIHTKETDIFLLGCLLFYILSRGQHPFGERESRNQLISDNLFLLKNCKGKHVEKLIEKMIGKEPGKRPSIDEVCDHPIFWNSSQIISFLKAFATDFPNLPIPRLSNNLSKETLDQTLITQVKKRKNLDIQSIWDILEGIKSAENDSDVFFWHRTFPNLFPAVYLATETSGTSIEEPHTVEFDCMLIHRFKELKFNEKVNQVKFRPGRFGDEWVNVIIISKSNEQLRTYSIVLKQIQSLHHENIMAVMFTENDTENCYIAIEPITSTLSSAINDQPHLVEQQSQSIFQQLAKGLTFLHSKKIVHGTLSPDEIVIEFRRSEILVKIAKLTPGPDDWGCPTSSEEDDVRRLGCIAYWIRFRVHPFGDSETRAHNIQQKLYRLSRLYPVERHLIWSMIDPIVPCNAVLFHPFFWSKGKIVSFFQAAHNFVVNEKIDIGLSYSSDFLLQIWSSLQERKDHEDICSFYFKEFDFPFDPLDDNSDIVS